MHICTCTGKCVRTHMHDFGADSCCICTFLGTHSSQERLVSVNKRSGASHFCKSFVVLYYREITVCVCVLQCARWGVGIRGPQCSPVPWGQGQRPVPAEERQWEKGHSVQSPQWRPGESHLQPDGEPHSGLCVFVSAEEVLIYLLKKINVTAPINFKGIFDKWKYKTMKLNKIFLFRIWMFQILVKKQQLNLPIVLMSSNMKNIK